MSSEGSGNGHMLLFLTSLDFATFLISFNRNLPWVGCSSKDKHRDTWAVLTER